MARASGRNQSRGRPPNWRRTEAVPECSSPSHTSCHGQARSFLLSERVDAKDGIEEVESPNWQLMSVQQQGRWVCDQL